MRLEDRNYTYPIGRRGKLSIIKTEHPPSFRHCVQKKYHCFPNISTLLGECTLAPILEAGVRGIRVMLLTID